jgi:hypothetical protein
VTPQVGDVVSLIHLGKGDYKHYILIAEKNEMYLGVYFNTTPNENFYDQATIKEFHPLFTPNNSRKYLDHECHPDCCDPQERSKDEIAASIKKNIKNWRGSADPSDVKLIQELVKKSPVVTRIIKSTYF